MNKPAVSILIPHLRNQANDAALRVALDCLITNTSVDYELIINTVRGDIYTICNAMAAQASAEWIVFGNSDVFFAPGWAEPMLEAAHPDQIVTGVIVECGAVGVHEANVCRNFGMTPETFDREAFEQWCAETPESRAGDGWYFPSLHSREAFLSFGGFDTSNGQFPTHSLDSEYWDRWRASGRQVSRVMSFSYHLQKYSDPDEQEKAIRHE